MKISGICTAAALLLPVCGGCQTTQTPTAAILTDATPAALSELERTISTALGGTEVTLSDEAFASSSVLTLEPARRQTPAGRMASGRTSQRPAQFQLLRTGDGCVLEWLNAGQRFKLIDTHCTAE